MASMELWADIYFSSITLKNAKGPLNVKIVTYCTLDRTWVHEQILNEVIFPPHLTLRAFESMILASKLARNNELYHIVLYSNSLSRLWSWCLLRNNFGRIAETTHDALYIIPEVTERLDSFEDYPSVKRWIWTSPSPWQASHCVRLKILSHCFFTVECGCLFSHF